jgi:hypothetical protein
MRRQVPSLHETEAEVFAGVDDGGITAIGDVTGGKGLAADGHRLERDRIDREVFDPHPHPSRFPHDDVEAQFVEVLSDRHRRNRVRLDLEDEPPPHRRRGFLPYGMASRQYEQQQDRARNPHSFSAHV